MKHHLPSPNCVWCIPSDVQEVTSPIFTKALLFYLRSLVYRLGETERRSSLWFWTDRSSAGEVVLSSRTTQWPPDVAVPPLRSSRFLDECAAANVSCGLDLKPSISVRVSRTWNPPLGFMSWIFYCYWSSLMTAEEPQTPAGSPRTLTYLSYKRVCSEPSRPSRGQCTGLLPPILYYETSSLMRPNKLVLDEPKLPPPAPTTTTRHTQHLIIFILSLLLPSLLFSSVRNHLFKLRGLGICLISDPYSVH